MNNVYTKNIRNNQCHYCLEKFLAVQNSFACSAKFRKESTAKSVESIVYVLVLIFNFRYERASSKVVYFICGETPLSELNLYFNISESMNVQVRQCVQHICRWMRKSGNRKFVCKWWECVANFDWKLYQWSSSQDPLFPYLFVCLLLNLNVFLFLPPFS